MSSNNIPVRKCVACNRMIEKNRLFRVVKYEDSISYDPTYKAMGRGSYVCRDKTCIALAKKKKSFNRSLRQAVSDEIFDKLIMELENDR